MLKGLYVKQAFFLSYCNETWTNSTHFRKNSNIFHENSSTWSRGVTCGQVDRRAIMTKIIAALWY